MLDTHKLDMPNRGIWRSARYGLFVGLGFGLFVGLFVGLWLGLGFGLFVGLIPGLVFGLFVGLSQGGAAFMQHFILRWFLWHARLMPWNYVRFLDYAAERILLRKVGGGYIFVHRLLLEYFASLDTTLLLAEASGQKQQA